MTLRRTIEYQVAVTDDNGDHHMQDVIGYPVSEHLAVNKSVSKYGRKPGEWSITHVATGYAVMHLVGINLKRVAKLARQFAKMTDWSFTEKEKARLVPKEVRREMTNMALSAMNIKGREAMYTLLPRHMGVHND